MHFLHLHAFTSEKFAISVKTTSCTECQIRLIFSWTYFVVALHLQRMNVMNISLKLKMQPRHPVPVTVTHYSSCFKSFNSGTFQKQEENLHWRRFKSCHATNRLFLIVKNSEAVASKDQRLSGRCFSFHFRKGISRNGHIPSDKSVTHSYTTESFKHEYRMFLRVESFIFSPYGQSSSRPEHPQSNQPAQPNIPLAVAQMAGVTCHRVHDTCGMWHTHL